MKIPTHLILAFALLSVSTASIIARWINDVPAMTMTFWRMVTASSLLWLFSLRFRQTRLSAANRVKTMTAGFFLGLHFVTFFTALKYTTIANATFLATLAPVFTLFFERIFYHRSLTRKLILGMGMALSGAFIIGVRDFQVESSHNLGNMLALSSSFWFAVTFLITERVRKEATTIAYSRLVYLSAAAAVLIMIPFAKAHLVGFQPYEYCGLLMLGIVPTILGHSLLYHSVKYSPPTVVLTIPLGEPIVASALAWIIFQEKTGVFVAAGGFMALAGIFTILREQAKMETATDQ